MTNLLARILLSIMVFPLAALIYIATMFCFFGRGRHRNEELGFLLATGCTAVFVVGYWLWLWRGSVRWTGRRVVLTLLSGMGAIMAGVAAGVGMSALSGINDNSFAIFIGGVFAIVLWIPATIVFWRENAAERAERIRQSAGDVLFCPRCGYNLTGLYEARCPECGGHFTLNQLFAAQRGQEIADAGTAAQEASERPAG